MCSESVIADIISYAIFAGQCSRDKHDSTYNSVSSFGLTILPLFFEFRPGFRAVCIYSSPLKRSAPLMSSLVRAE